jgi:hypothetical protein
MKWYVCLLLLLVGCGSVSEPIAQKTLPSPSKLASYNEEFAWFHYAIEYMPDAQWNNNIQGAEINPETVEFNPVDGNYLSDHAFAVYAMEYVDSPQGMKVMLCWLDTNLNPYYVGFSNWDKDRWDWVSSLDKDSSSEQNFDYFKLNPEMLDKDGRFYMVVLTTQKPITNLGQTCPLFSLGFMKTQ